LASELTDAEKPRTKLSGAVASVSGVEFLDELRLRFPLPLSILKRGKDKEVSDIIYI